MTNSLPTAAALATNPFMSTGAVLLAIGLAKPKTCCVIELKSCSGSVGPPSMAPPMTTGTVGELGSDGSVGLL
jgi:hypothetical protein